MRKLSTEEIEKFSSRDGVRKIAVENFLMSMGENPMVAFGNLSMDAGLYNWNSKTVNTIRSGINLAFRK